MEDDMIDHTGPTISARKVPPGEGWYVPTEEADALEYRAMVRGMAIGVICVICGALIAAALVVAL